MIKNILTVVASSVLSVLIMTGLLVGHVAYENSHYVPPPTLEQKLANVVSVYSDVGYCSGWVLSGTKTVVTAAHCAEGLDPTTVFEVDFGDTVKHPFHIQKLGDADLTTAPDMMTLTTNDKTIHWPAGLAVCSFKPYYGEAIDLIGGPLGLVKSITFGHVAYADRPLPDIDTVPFDHFIQYDGVMMPGNSGGPAVDDLTGCVIGQGELASMQEIHGVPFLISYLTAATELEKLK